MDQGLQIVPDDGLHFAYSGYPPTTAFYYEKFQTYRAVVRSVQFIHFPVDRTQGVLNTELVTTVLDLSSNPGSAAW